MKKGFVILDFGSQYTWLLARSFRELGYYSEVCAYDIPLSQIKEKEPLGLIISGGPASVLDQKAPRRCVEELRKEAPVLAVCYGMQMTALEYGGEVVESGARNYGKSLNIWKTPMEGLKRHTVWMSHGDSVKKLPPNAKELSLTENGLTTGFAMDNLWAFQFHPEVSHTEGGQDILRAFARDLCKAPPLFWNTSFMEDKIIENIQEKIPASDKVFCALSGGVDSTVTACLLNKALGVKRVHCLFVNNGLLRKGEFEEVLEMYQALDLNVKGVNEEEFFLSQLKDVTDPESKRKIIGHAFIEVFEKQMQDCQWLAQGTLYPDVIESLSLKGPAVTIKSHHNVGGLPEKLNLKLVEPLRYLFKDEVRELGRRLKIPKDVLGRHPFPGPGLAVRCPGVVTEKKLSLLREVDFVFIDELKRQNLYNHIWQAFALLLPVSTVGVQGDSRTYESAVALRAVTSRDGMTADWYPFSSEFLHKVSDRIINEVKGVNRVVYDITSKPPGTIEWE